MWPFSSRNLRKKKCNQPHRGSFQPRLETLEDRCLLTGGILDPTFGTSGLVTTSVGTADSAASAVATYPNAGTANDGKVVAVGYSINPKKGPAGDENFAVVRYNLNGTLDTSFGGVGKVTTDLGTTSDVATDVVVQPDGKVVAAGYAGSNFSMVRYNANGSLDTTFGGKGTGIVATSLGRQNSSAGWSMVLQADGKIDLAGVSAGDLAVVRYNADGTLDSFFGSGGKITHALTSPLYTGADPVDMAIDTGTSSLDPNAGKIVVAAEYGNTQGSFAVVRLNTNGSPDTSFGSTGSGYVNISTLFGKPAVAVQSDDRIVVGGLASAGPNAGFDIGLARFNADGTLDSTFGSGGLEVTPGTASDGIGSLTLQPDGEIVAAGTQQTANAQSFLVARFNPADGNLDTSFGNAGIAVSTGVAFANRRVDVALEPDGRIVLAGTSTTGAQVGGFALSRVLAAGPQIGSFIASANSVSSGDGMMLTASGITDGNPNSTITQVTFYYIDSNGTQQGLGYAIQTSAGVWTLNFTVGLPLGVYTLYAQAQDNWSVIGDPLVLTLQVS